MSDLSLFVSHIVHKRQHYQMINSNRSQGIRAINNEQLTINKVKRRASSFVHYSLLIVHLYREQSRVARLKNNLTTRKISGRAAARGQYSQIS